MMYDQLQETLSFLKEKTDIQPAIGFILGTGLGNLTADIEISLEISYQEIPHFPVSTVQSHSGKLIFGHLEGKPIVALAGRFHYYEGYSMQQVTFPIRVLALLGIKMLWISSAVGSTNPSMKPGHIVLIKDHINLQAVNPLRGPNDDRLGPRFPDMLKGYDTSLRALALEAAKEAGISLHQGVYVALQGPNLETPAEYEFLHRIGGDVVGMSTVPEVLVAKHMELPVLVTAVVSNLCYPPEAIQETTVEDVIRVVEEAEPRLRQLVKQLVTNF